MYKTAEVISRVVSANSGVWPQPAQGIGKQGTAVAQGVAANAKFEAVVVTCVAQGVSHGLVG